MIARQVVRNGKEKDGVEMPGIEPGASHMQSERSTTELHVCVRSFGNLSEPFFDTAVGPHRAQIWHACVDR